MTTKLIEAALQSARAGDLPRAALLLRQATQSEPDNQEAWRCLGFVLGSTGSIEEAISCCTRALQMDPRDFEIADQLARLQMNAGRFEEAAKSFQLAITANPGTAGFHQGLGQALMLQAKNSAAEAAFRRAIELDPAGTAASYDGLAQIRLSLGQRPEAIALFRKAHECDPNGYRGKLCLARACIQDEKLQDAEQALRAAISLEPGISSAYVLLGRTLQQLGQFDEAERTLQKALELNPTEGAAYMALTHARKMKEEDSGLVEQIRSGLRSGRLRPADKSSLHFALGKCLNDLGEYESALQEYDRANEVMRQTMLQGRPFDRTTFKKIYDHVAGVFTPEFFRRYQALGSESSLPIFIVGMMRSGTTLVEQILSSHPDVGDGGEIAFWADADVEVLGPSGRLPDAVSLKRVQAKYLDLLQRLAPGKPHVTNKMPANYLALGMIHLAFPNAKIIHCQRDPVDTVLSIYMTPNSVPVPYGYVRENLVYAYREYRRLMKLFRKVLPEQTMMEVQYEDLVQNQESATRRMLEFLEIEWDDACLHPEQNRRAITTPTLWQARQPIYKTSVKRWKNYEPWLGAFAELME